MQDMDVKVIPNEAAADAGFESHELSNVESAHVGELEVGTQVKMKFPNFAKLVATHSFEDILEKNKDADVVLSADLLADLANADLVDDEKKQRVILVLGGIVLGILIAMVFVGGGA